MTTDEAKLETAALETVEEFAARVAQQSRIYGRESVGKLLDLIRARDAAVRAAALEEAAKVVEAMEASLINSAQWFRGLVAIRIRALAEDNK